MRAMAREVAFRVIFASFFCEQEEGLKSALCKSENLTKDDIEYVDRVLSLVNNHRDEEEQIIEKLSLSFAAQRIYLVDKSILYVGIAEIMYMDDIPPQVSCNEAANLASKYSTEKSASYVSGILGEVINSYVHFD